MAKKRNKWHDFPVYLIVRFLLAFVQALTLKQCERLARSMAWLFCDVLRIRHTIVEDNLTHAYPNMSSVERSRIERAMWEHLFLLVAEVVHAPVKIHETNWRDYLILENQRDLVRLLISDRPTVLVSGHYGNFELSGFMLGLFGFTSYAIARPIENRFIDRALNRFRGMYGQHILPKEGSAGPANDVLKGGGTLGLLADQHAGPKGCWVDFFGRPASTHKAIALFSMGCDAPLVMSYTRRFGGPLQHVMCVPGIADPRSGEPEVANVRALTEWYTRQLEAIVRDEPRQYWWLHRRWRPKPLPASAAKAA